MREKEKMEKEREKEKEEAGSGGSGRVFRCKCYGVSNTCKLFPLFPFVSCIGKGKFKGKAPGGLVGDSIFTSKTLMRCRHFCQIKHILLANHRCRHCQPMILFAFQGSWVVEILKNKRMALSSADGVCDSASIPKVCSLVQSGNLRNDSIRRPLP